MLRSSDAAWSNPRVLTIFVLIFVSGIAVGAAATRTFLHPRMALPYIAKPVGLQDLRNELNLTAEQQRVVMQELDDYAKYYQNIEEEREDVAEHGKRRILAVLNTTQRKRFLEIFKSPALPTPVANGEAPH